MHSKALELQERVGRFSKQVAQLLIQLPDNPSARKLTRSIEESSTAVERGYRDACASSSPEQFIDGISAVARKAKRINTSLALLVQLEHVSIEAVRDVILEARALEAIFTASRKTAKKRARGRMTPRKNPSERAAQAADGKPPRRRQSPRGVT